MKSFVLSFQSNITQFLSNDKYRSNVKWKKILNSYINVSRIFLESEKIQKIKNGFPTIGQKLILAISMIDIKKDKIKVNEEIEYICDLFINNKDVIVIPIYGCTTNVFRTILYKFPTINMIHLAGHTLKKDNGQVLLTFVDSNMTFLKFSDFIFNHKFECSFLNCCSTFEFVSSSSYLLNSYASILHSGYVLSNIAFNFAKDFYKMISSGVDINISWKEATKKCKDNPFNYSILLH